MLYVKNCRAQFAKSRDGRAHSPRAEARLRSGPVEAGEPGWRTLRRSAAASIGLWFSIAFAGVALVNT
jgi:hypothetical protein